MFQLVGASRQYGATQALAPTDLILPDGEVTVLIGPSGCGKSTLLRLLVGLIEPTTGSITYKDRPVTQASAPALRRDMGYVIQEGGLFPHLTARQNVALMPRYLRWPADRIDGRVRELAELTHFPTAGLDRYPAELSGGQRQRVGLIRALMLDPDVLLLDEPLGALDPLIRYELQGELRQIFRSVGKTVVLVTHDMGEARYLGDRIVLMRAGRIVQEGSFAALHDNPVDPFVTQFIRAQRSHLEDEEGSGK